MSRRPQSPSLVVGWREWIGLPELGVPAVKAKMDTGARSSALHAFELEHYVRGGARRVRFTIHPWQRDTETAIEVDAVMVEERHVRSSSGLAELRPVILTMVELGGRSWPIELTLTRRDEMGFRMLLGRQALRGRFMVDASRSFVFGKEALPRGRRAGRRRREGRKGHPK